MCRFLDRLPPEDVEAIAAQACVEMVEGGSTRVGEFHYPHHVPDGRPYDDPAEMAARVAVAAARSLGVPVGLRADLVALDEAHPALVGREGDALLDGWMFAGASPVVSAVRARGHMVVREGRHGARGAVLRRFRGAVGWVRA